MKERLLPENLLEFQSRFGTFHDAVIHDVKLNLFSESDPTSIQITVGAREFNNGKSNQLVNVTFEVDKIKKFQIRQERKHLLSIIFRLNIGFFGNEVYLDFFPSKDNPINAADFEEKKHPASVAFLVIGEECYWHTSPYSERVGNSAMI